MATHFAASIYHLHAQLVKYSSYDAFHPSKHGAVFKHKPNLKSFNDLDVLRPSVSATVVMILDGMII